ncbi:MAG: chemotaxis protein CheD [Spirochaetota bacterium]
MNFQLINVGIADLRVAKSPDVLRTILGSCVGICLYDPEIKTIGLSHIMLADQTTIEGAPGKYAGTAIPILIEQMVAAGADEKRIIAKIVGGAMMFKMADNSLMGEIGRKNVKRVKEVLSEYSISIVAEETGGDFGRTIDFFSEDGTVRVKSLGRPEKTI